MRKILAVLVVLWLCCVFYGVGHCLTELNRAIEPQQELRAFKCEMISENSCRVDFLDLSFTVNFPTALRALADHLRQVADAGLTGFEHFLGIKP
ncbi:MAG: hypothetical protein AB1426_11960 [Bacillota bacterium]